MLSVSSLDITFISCLLFPVSHSRLFPEVQQPPPKATPFLPLPPAQRLTPRPPTKTQNVPSQDPLTSSRTPSPRSSTTHPATTQPSKQRHPPASQKTKPKAVHDSSPDFLSIRSRSSDRHTTSSSSRRWSFLAFPWTLVTRSSRISVLEGLDPPVRPCQ